MHVFFNNYSPLESIITISGIFRLVEHPIHLSSVELKKPEYTEWFSEFFKILYYGPQYTKLILSIPPHTRISINLQCDQETLSVISGFKHSDITWGLLKEGSHEIIIKNRDISLDIKSIFDQYMMEHAVYGRAAKVENISIDSSITSNDEDWHTFDQPVTIVNYHNKFRESFWTPQINSTSIY